MKRLIGSVLFFCAVVACAFGQEGIKLPASAKGEPGDFITVKAETEGKTVRWFAADPGLRLFPVELLKDTRTAVVIGRVPGKYRLLAWTALKDGEPTGAAVCTVVVEGEVPPVPPVPPGPVPPGPLPPVPAAGLSVLIVYETGTASKLPAAQQQILYGKATRDYLNAKCIAGPDGRTKEWRIYDVDVDLSAEAPLWRDLMGRPRQSVPWLVVADKGKVLYEGVLPANVDEALTLLRRFGG